MKRLGTPRRVRRILDGKMAQVLRVNSRDVGEHRTRKRFTILVEQHRKVLAIGDLLIRALAIKRDLARRVLREPNSKVLLKEQRQYERLVRQLIWEHKTALADFLAAIRGVRKKQ